MMLRGRSAWLVVGALALSVLVNVFLGGYVAGQFRELRTGAGLAAALMEVWPEAYRKPIRRALVADRAALLESFATLRKERRQMLEAIKAEPFDENAVRDRMDDVRDATTAVQKRAQETVLKAIIETRRAEKT